jgi:hypothetical protein
MKIENSTKRGENIVSANGAGRHRKRRIMKAKAKMKAKMSAAAAAKKKNFKVAAYQQPAKNNGGINISEKENGMLAAQRSLQLKMAWRRRHHGCGGAQQWRINDASG